MKFLEDFSSHLHVLGHLSVAVEKAARHGSTLVVDDEARRLLVLYPDCSMSMAELQDRLIRLAAKRGVRVQFG